MLPPEPDEDLHDGPEDQTEFQDHDLDPNGWGDPQNSEPLAEAGDTNGSQSNASPVWFEAWQRIITWVIVAACCGFVLYSLHPGLIFANTTPTGGDMGAHVWGPPFLRDHLLTQFRLSGWTMDWYAGFPVYLFYMVVPSLFILWLSVGPPIWVSPFLLVGLGVVAYRFIPRIKVPWQRHFAIGVTVFLAVLVVPIPYNIAFKLVVVSGLVTLPIATCALARSLRAPFPVAPLVAVATLPFIYDKGFTILGGNGASTMAGEFAFSISLTLAIFYLAVLFKGAETGRWRAPGAILLALTVLCHIIPAIFVVIVTLVVVPFLRRQPQQIDEAIEATEVVAASEGQESHDSDEQLEGFEPTSNLSPVASGSVSTSAAVDSRAEQPWWAKSRTGSIVAGLAIFALWLLVVVDRTWLNATASHDPAADGPASVQRWFPAFATVCAIAFFTSFQPRLSEWARTRLGSAIAIAVTVFVGGIVVVWPGWWVLALCALLLCFVYFVTIDLRSIGWVLVVAPVAALVTAFWMLPFLAGSTYMNDMGWEKYTRYWDYLLAVPEIDSGGMPLRSIVLVTAGIGLVLSVVMKVRLGWMLGLIVAVFAWMFRFFPQYRLWNARLLPFYFLAIYLLAGVAGALIIRWFAGLILGGKRQASARFLTTSIATGVAATLVLVGLVGSFKQLPGGTIVADSKKPTTNLFRWMGINFPIGIVPDWAAWNFSGVERKPAYPEFKGVVDMMRNVGESNGCGRAFWEFDPELNRFGTTMSLMMLPYYSDGCIGSMEGLYFEASSTTPFHFLMQSALSTTPSRAQREMPYPSFDMNLGVQQMQLMGVRYYMASSEQAIKAAEADARLEKVAEEEFPSSSSDNSINRWAVFELRGVRLVEGLSNQPVVLKNANDHIDGWVYDEKRLPQTEAQREQGTPGSKSPGPAVEWFMDPTRWDVFLATSGPKNWQRTTPEQANKNPRPAGAVNISNVKMEQDSVSFDVDRTGVPVLVKVSYFPNWKASGAEGPYRVTPNFMVVVPTDKHVSLTYERSTADLAGVGLSVVGVAGLFGLAVLDDRKRRRDELVEHCA